MNVKQLLSKACTGHSAASFLLWNTLPSFIVSSAYSVKQMYSTVTTLLQSTQTIREQSPSSMLILAGYRLDKSTRSERERKSQTFAINSFKTWHINDPQDKAQEEHSTYTAEHIETFSVTASLNYQLFRRNVPRLLSYTISVEKKCKQQQLQKLFLDIINLSCTETSSCSLCRKITSLPDNQVLDLYLQSRDPNNSLC